MFTTSWARSKAFAALLGAAFAACTVEAGAQSPASDTTYQLDIPSQNLNDALQALALASRHRLFYQADIVSGKVNKALSGKYTTEEAIRTMLEGTELRYEISADGVVIVKEKESAVVGETAGISGSEKGLQLAQTDATPASSDSESERAETKGSDKEELQEVIVDIPEILVVGSKSLNSDIRRTEDDTQPYVVFDAEQIARSGATNIEDFLRSQLPMNSQALSSSQVAAGGVPARPGLNQGSTMAGGLDLRGLGTDETLVLIDGRRVPGVALPGGGVGTYSGTAVGQPNISGIPASAIERIEILPSTAGGIYGGSATGGVVNIILKRDYSGLDAALVYGDSFEGDSTQKTIILSGGASFKEGATNLTFSASHGEQDTLTSAQRPFVRRGREMQMQNNPEPNSLQFSFSDTPNFCGASVFGAFGFCDGTELFFDDGTAYGAAFGSVPAGYEGPGADNGIGLLTGSGQINPNYSGFGLFSAPTTDSVSLTLRQKLAPSLEMFVDVSGSRVKSSSSSPLQLNVTLPGDSPYNPFQQDVVANYFVPGAAAPADFGIKTRAARAGAVMRLPYSWSLNAEYGWSQSSNSGNLYGDTFRPPALVAALQPFALTDPRVVPPEIDDQLIPTNGFSLSGAKNTLNDISIRASGPIMQLPAGPLTLSALAQRREDSINDIIDAYIGPFGSTLYWTPARSQTIDSLYVESRFPLFSESNSAIAVRALELMAAVRYDTADVETFNSHTEVSSTEGPFPDVRLTHATNDATSYTLGLRYSPTSSIVLRGSYSTGFLPPNLGQIAPNPPEQSFFFDLLDPLRGGTLVEAGASGELTYLSGGSPDIRPELSKSTSAGIIWTPSSVPGLRASLDWNRIKKTDEIGQLFTQALINNEASLPGRIVRGPNLPTDEPGWAGPIISVDATLVNFASSELDAWDFRIDYKRETEGLGEWRLYILGSRLTSNGRQVTLSSSSYDTVGFYDGPLEWRANFGVDWQAGQWAAGWSAQYFDGYSVNYADPLRADPTREISQGSAGIPHQIYQDLYLSYRIAESTRALGETEVTLGIQNVFNEEPPILALAIDPYGYSSYGDPRLRRFTLSLRKHF